MSSPSSLLLGAILTQCLLLASCAAGESQLRRARVDYEQPEHVMDRNEQEALYQVMESLLNESSQWRAKHPHPCSSYHPWPGLECQQLGGSSGSSSDDYLLHVTKITLVGSNPATACKKNASLSPAIFKLPFLRALVIMSCFVSPSTNSTNIPWSGLDKLASSLQVLTLRGNSGLTGTIPKQLGSLAKLEVLSLSQNGLHGSVPVELGGLEKLQNLDLSYNSLAGAIPGELGRLQSLSILDLSNNKLGGHIPDSIGKLAQLKKLDLSSNALDGSIPAALGSLSNLQFLALDRNGITGGIPRELQGLSNLQSLLLQDNPMHTTIPDFWKSLGKISQLRLSNSGYTGGIPGSIVLLKNLTELALERNFLTGSIPESLGSLPNIYHLNLSNNLLSGLVPFAPSFYARLGDNLDLHGNTGLCSTAAARSDDLRSCPGGKSSQSLSSSSSSSAPSQQQRVLRSFFSISVFFYFICTIP
ncbi:piriformospora indica-insensitive protein 2 [Selaginella moellendorffii]|nr:piriformospora indica-insensitive protein 2 [Selaginella moellendorffii]|eukprot:XP_002987784.2 piriformospora indica-insensitive protein 2 [Selaginella moellendorffii]